MSEITQDSILKGHVLISQYKAGYRMAVDTVLLAASVRGDRGARALDLGCGVGGAMLCLAQRCPDLQIDGLELQPHLAQLAQTNITDNGYEGRMRVFEGDILNPPVEIRPDTYDHVFANPPFLQDDRGHHPPDGSKRLAHVESHTSLADWVKVALKVVKTKGSITFVQRADRLADLLLAMDGKAGEMTVFPIWPKVGQDANRVIVRARKGIKTPLVMAPGLVLHTDEDRYTDLAQAVMEGGGLSLR
ncbi:methyltransferase [Magnetovibrio sp. PR-2]|uniref:tRNA1(Val) (adenine(37)-N6)-methyltransferase n=1 Tax=Magnetovibrio sp. PR-2 TaxID=3120356 RepID=UPI002FCDF80D